MDDRVLDEMTYLAGDPELDALPLEPTRPDPRRPRSLVALWAGIVALMGATVFALFFLADNGADGPEKAVERLFEAVSNEDVLGMMDALPPSERDVLKDYVTGLGDELERLQVLSGDLELSKVPGLDLAVEDLDLSSSSIGEGVSVVRILGGTGRYAVTPKALPLGELVRTFVGDQLPGQTISGESSLAALDLDQLVTIQEGGRWYVSLWYSVAEAARRDAGAAVPSFGHGLKAKGESSPDAAFRAMAEAGLKLDGRRALELLPPDEARVLHDYAPLFLEAMEREAATARETLSLRLDELETSVKRDGDRASIDVTKVAVSGTIDGDAVGFRFDGRCVELTEGGETERMCDDEPSALSPFFGLFPGAVQGRIPTIVAVERDGAWYLSPTRTMLGSFLDSLRDMDDDDLRNLVGSFVGGSEGESRSATGIEVEPGWAPVPPSPGSAPVPTISSLEEFEQLSPEEKERVLRGQVGNLGEPPVEEREATTVPGTIGDSGY